MDFPNRVGALFASLAFIWCNTAHADDHEGLSMSESHYDLRRLMQPTAAETAAEQSGRVHIYDSLEINEVNAALDAHFDRIQNMMFTRIHHLPPPGAGPGEEADVEDDGCD